MSRDDLIQAHADVKLLLQEIQDFGPVVNLSTCHAMIKLKRSPINPRMNTRRFKRRAAGKISAAELSKSISNAGCASDTA